MDSDTINLLKEVNSGCKMATSSMEQIIPSISNQSFAKLVHDYNTQHINLGDEAHELLNKHHADEKDPHPIAKAMSWITTETKITLKSDHTTLAKMLMDGCNMGIQSISTKINEYKEADDESIAIAKRLVKLEEEFMADCKKYL